MQSLKKKFSIIIMFCLMWVGTSIYAAVNVQVGPTKIDQGMANHKEDITIYNDKIAISFAVGSSNYWNMTNGSILDVAIMNEDGSFGCDLVNDVEFLNNLWSATGSYNGENLLEAQEVTYTLYKQGKQVDKDAKDADQVVVTAKTRYWTAEHKEPLEVVIEYTLEDGKNYVGLKTIVTNPEGNDTYKNMYSGYSISTLAANMFGPYGYYPDVKATGIGIGAAVDEAFGNFVATYGKASYNRGYAVSVQLDGANSYKGSSGYKDVYILRDIEPGKTYTYTGEMLVSNQDATMPILERYYEKDPSIKKGNVSGKVSFENKGLANSYILIEKEGSYIDTKGVKQTLVQPFVWGISDQDGQFDFRLPEGKYYIHAEAKGYTPSEKEDIEIKQDTKLVKDMSIQQGAKAKITAVDEKGNPIAAKIEVSGVATDIKTLGSNVFFTDPDTKEAAFSIPAGELTFKASYGKDFESKEVTIQDKTIKPGEVFEHQFVIPTLIDTRSKKWYNMDNHEHSDIGDGATPIDQLYAAQVAAKLDLNVVSDHDSISNDKEMAELAANGKRVFLPSLEVSPGWGHWGILNVDYSKAPISPQLKPAEIIKAGHDMGAVVVLNHPYTDYGFLKNRDGVNGGFDKGSEDFDLIELQSTMDLSVANNMDKLALDAAMGYWNKGVKKYLSAGSDQHDVTSTLYPGIIRLYAYIEDELTVESYLNALVSGNAYVTMGPILLPEKESMFGTTQKIDLGQSYTLKMDVQAVNGLKEISVYCDGQVIKTISCEETTDVYKLCEEVKPDKDCWYSIVALDSNGHYAVSNPIWVTVNK